MVLGILVGTGAAAIRSTRIRAFTLPIGSIVGGVCASAINGELANERWAFFLSVDALLVWLFAFGSCAFVLGIGRLRRRRRASAEHAGLG